MALSDLKNGDSDLQPEVTKQNDVPEFGVEPEEDDHGGGYAGDEGEADDGRL
jgi:hypothetical protein